jgi:hypothetical protein
MFFGEQGYRRVVRPHPLWAVLSEVGQHRFHPVADDDGEPVILRLRRGLPRDPHSGSLRQIHNGTVADNQIEGDAALDGSLQGCREVVDLPGWDDSGKSLLRSVDRPPQRLQNVSASGQAPGQPGLKAARSGSAAAEPRRRARQICRSAPT